jgi:hypothetical protein
MASGLFGKSVLEVAAVDGIDVPWCVRVDGSAGSGGRLEALKTVVTQCLAAEPGGRPKVAALLGTVGDLLAAEVAEVGPAALDSEAQRVAEAAALRDATARIAVLEEAAATTATRHASELAAVQEAATAEITALQQAAAGSANRHAAEVAALRDTVSALEASLVAHSADHEAQLASAASRHAAEASLRVQHSGEKDALTALVAQLRQQLASVESVGEWGEWGTDSVALYRWCPLRCSFG